MAATLGEFTVAVIGGGASGTLLAGALVRAAGTTRVVLIDPCTEVGRGVAYATACPAHVLNAPAAKMSALAEAPDHFLRWLEARGEGYGGSSFVPRGLYGEYVRELAVEFAAAAVGRWRHVRARAVDVRDDGERVRVVCSDGGGVDADAIVVAIGNPLPAPWPNVSDELRGTGRFFDSAWQDGATVPGSADEPVVLLGTGLTAADAVFGLRANGHRGKIVMVSRRGLLPLEHRFLDVPASSIPEGRTLPELLDAVRALVDGMREPGEQWRRVIDDVRPHTNAIWKALPLEEQRRFFRHALPYWNAHRHRIAPDAAFELAALLDEGTLRVLPGRTGEIVATGGSAHVPVAVRGSAEIVTIEAARVLNCSGPQHDFRKLDNPFVRSLLACGAMVPNPLGIGVRVSDDGALVGADGVASRRFFTIGPARFGTLIETTAIPEIREQARELARILTETFAPANCGREARRAG